MKNTHLNHPEDEILTGNLSVLDCIYAKDSKLSLKIDGSPAIVWGKDPATGTFFVGTKSVFNKKKIMIAHSHEEIDALYTVRNVADILHACFEYLPRTDRIIQGDFMGFCGNEFYTPNTLTYKFAEEITEMIVIAPHTEYASDTTLRDAEVISYDDELVSTDDCKFFHAIVDRKRTSDTIPDINWDDFQWLNKKQAADACKIINRRIADGLELTDEFLSDLLGHQLANLYLLVIDIKEYLMSNLIVYSEAQAYYDGEKTDHEGYVISNEYGMIKLIDRPTFAARNFNRVRN